MCFNRNEYNMESWYYIIVWTFENLDKLDNIESRVEQLFMRFHISVKPSSTIG